MGQAGTCVLWAPGTVAPDLLSCRNKGSFKQQHPAGTGPVAGLGQARPGFLGLWCLCGEVSGETWGFLIWARPGVALVEPCQARCGPADRCVSAWCSPLGAFLGFSQAPGKLVLSPLDERDRVQKKTFTKWVNKHLIKVSGPRFVSREGSPAHTHTPPRGFSHFLRSPFISETCYFLLFLPHLLCLFLPLPSGLSWSLL